MGSVILLTVSSIEVLKFKKKKLMMERKFNPLGESGPKSTTKVDTRTWLSNLSDSAEIRI